MTAQPVNLLALPTSGNRATSTSFTINCG